jgi:ankyrin repeat protein
MQKHIEYLKQNFSSHPNLELTCRIFSCLQYVHDHIDDIVAKVGKEQLFKHLESQVTIHLSYLSGEIAKDSLLNLYAEILPSMEILESIADPAEHQAVFVSFLNNICDSEKGCMEARLRPALMFLGYYLSNGCQRINDIMLTFMNEVNHRPTVLDILDFFASRIEHRLPVKDLDGQIKLMTWSIVKKYMIDTLLWETYADDWLKLHKQLEPSEVRHYTRRNGWVALYFNSDGDANRLLSYIKAILPESFQSDLSKADVNRARGKGYVFQLTAMQYACYQSIVENVTCEQQEEIQKKPEAEFEETQKKPEAEFKVEPKQRLAFGKLLQEAELYVSNDQKWVLLSFKTINMAESSLQFISKVLAPKDKYITQARVTQFNQLVTHPFRFRLNINQWNLLGEILLNTADEYIVPESVLKVMPDLTSPITIIQNEKLDSAASNCTNPLIIIKETEKLAKPAFKTRMVVLDYMRKLKNQFKARVSYNNMTEIPVVILTSDLSSQTLPLYDETCQIFDKLYAQFIFENASLRMNMFGSESYEFLLGLSCIKLNHLLTRDRKFFVNILNQGHLQLFVSLLEISGTSLIEAVNDILKYSSRREVLNICFNCIASGYHKIAEPILNQFRSRAPSLLLSQYDNQFQNNQTCLHLIAQKKLPHLFDSVLAMTIDINSIDDFGHTPLMEACASGSVEIARALLNQKNILTTQQNKQGENALILAIKGGHQEIVIELLKAQEVIAEINHQTASGHTAFMLAASQGDRAILELLLNFDLDLTKTRSPFAYCARQFDLKNQIEIYSNIFSLRNNNVLVSFAEEETCLAFEVLLNCDQIAKSYLDLYLLHHVSNLQIDFSKDSGMLSILGVYKNPQSKALSFLIKHWDVENIKALPDYPKFKEIFAEGELSKILRYKQVLAPSNRPVSSEEQDCLMRENSSLN